MDRRNLLIVGGLIGAIIVLLIGVIVFVLPEVNIFIDEHIVPATFDNSTPKATAISVARLNLGKWGFDNAEIKSVHSEGKYWIVEIYTDGYNEGFEAVTIDSETWMSKQNDSAEPLVVYDPKDTWRSLDELKAIYIAEIQSSTTDVSKPQKITVNDKEIWKITVYDKDSYELGMSDKVEYVYVDVATGKSKNTWNEFNNAAGTDGWLTLKQVDDTLNKIQKEMTGSVGIPFRNALRDLYPE